MTKRYGDSAHGLSVKVKKRRGVLVRTVNIPDSDDEGEGSPSNVNAEYARTVKTRVTTSGKAGSVIMNTLQVFEVEDTPRDSPELIVNSYEEVMVDNTRSTAETVKAKKQRKKANDSVSPFHYRLIHSR
jgi:hypothetical protein